MSDEDLLQFMEEDDVGYSISDKAFEYLFDGDAADSSGFGNDGVVTGATPTTDYLGRANKSYDFMAGVDRVVAPDSINNTNLFAGGGTLVFKFKTPTGIFLFGGDAGRLLQKGASNETLIFMSPEPSNLLRLNIIRQFSITQGFWRNITLKQTTEYVLIISYDDSSAANKPLAWLKEGAGALTSLVLTEVTPPVGTATTDTGNDMYIGNRVGNDRGYYGKIHDCAGFTKILTSGERDTIVSETP